jgi:arylsulfatase
MVTRTDRDVGAILEELRRQGLDRRTIVIFTSDNGPTFNRGTDSAYFESVMGRRGLKGELYEGGIRVPRIARWPGRASRGRVSEVVTANWGLFPTLATVCGVPKDAQGSVDGVDVTPAIVGCGGVAPREHLYWEYHAGGGWQAVRLAGKGGEWKGVRRDAK